MLNFSVNGQLLKLKNKPFIAADSIDYLTAQFAFNDEWTGLVKAASFEQGATKYTIILTEDAILEEDHLNLSEGVWYANVVGVEVVGETTVKRITSGNVSIKVYPSMLADGSSAPASPLAFSEQLLAAANQSLYELAVANGFEGTLEEWLGSLYGNGIVSIVLTETVGLVDTYTITMDDETTYTFDVTNGSTGKGISSIVKTGTVGLVDTYTITFTDATTTTFDITNGQDGQGSPSDDNPLMNGSAAPGVAVAYSRKDHVHPSDTSKAGTAVASTSANGLSPQATAPSTGLRNFLGIDNGETAHSDKALFDVTAPTTQEFGDAAVVGTAMTAARRDHKHAMPAAPTLSSLGAAAIETIAAIGYGVISGGLVAAQGTPDQTVNVPAHTIITPEGKYYSVAQTASLAATAADATNPRIDIVYDTDAGVTTYLAGTAAGSPTQPSTPSNGTLLASITRAANDNTISSSDITDKRKPVGSQQWATVTESSNTFAFDMEYKAEKYFEILIADTNGKTFTLSHRPYGACTLAIKIRATSTAATKTWTLDGQTVAWVGGSAPSLTAGKTYQLMFDWDTRGARWIGSFDLGAAN